MSITTNPDIYMEEHVSIQDQYTDTIKRTQENWADLIESFTQNIQAPFGQPVKGFSYPDFNRVTSQAIDQVFDYWAKAVEIQRDVAKQVVASNFQLIDQIGAQAETAQNVVQDHARNIGELAREQAETVKGAAQEQAEAAKDAAEEQAAERYESMTKADLQAELGRRDLPTTGNVDELRARLIEADLKA